MQWHCLCSSFLRHKNGGELQDINLAQYIFSDDWEHADTKELASSEAYLQQHLAVFSSQYVLDSIQQGIDNVSLGKYFLVPTEIQEYLRSRSFKRPLVSGNQKNTDSFNTGKNEKNKTQVGKDLQLNCRSRSLSPTELGRERPKNSPRKSHSTKQGHANENKTKQVTVQRTDIATESPVTKHKTCHSPSSTKLIQGIQSLPKVSGPLQSLHPGKDGVTAEYLTMITE